IYDELYELCSALSSELPSISPEEIDELNEKLYKAQLLEEKYKLPYPLLVEKLKEELKELEEANELKERIHILEERLNDALRAYGELAQALSRERKRSAKELEKKLKGVLSLLGLGDGDFEVVVREEREGRYGKDAVDFLFRGGELWRVASGGELSRMVLAISLILPQRETYVFDEVDAGLSGEASLRLARLLKELSRNSQVILITHAPALCAAGDRNFMTRKEGARVVVEELSREEKLAEVARLMGVRSEKTLAGARELVSLFSESPPFGRSL
ncbi:MAG: AAA family ATPase, partial [Aquificae bacterium]|nr:AAA family ATPase [Aquificota bacterium]